jgi:hypothetical protein
MQKRLGGCESLDITTADVRTDNFSEGGKHTRALAHASELLRSYFAAVARIIINPFKHIRLGVSPPS